MKIRALLALERPWIHCLFITALVILSPPEATPQIYDEWPGNDFRLLSFERDGNGYQLTIQNNNTRAFANFLVVVIGKDISGIEVYRQEVTVEFIEGKSAQTFTIPGYDERIFQIKCRVLIPPFEYYIE